MSSNANADVARIQRAAARYARMVEAAVCAGRPTYASKLQRDTAKWYAMAREAYVESSAVTQERDA